jgi:hypothetical protein
MCPPKAPKAPKMADIPQRQAAVMPDGGDPSVRMGLRGMHRLTRSAMIFTNQSGTLGMPGIASTSTGG